MYRIIGTDKITGKVVDVTTADNPTEKALILRQERKNYRGLKAIPLRVHSYRQFYAAEMA